MKAIAVAAAVLWIFPSFVYAHGDAVHPAKPFDASKAEQKEFGRAGNPKAVKRTMTITMSDTMRFSPASFVIKKGETVRLVVRNDGRTLHELVLGTEAELARHAELMRKFPGMVHDEPYMVHVKPGKTEDLIWTFNRPGEFRFACLVPGHYEAGMVGKITVQ